MASILTEHQQFVDDGGKPLVGGLVYIGDVNSDPVTNPKSIFSDRALTTALANPQTIGSDGRTENKIWTDGTYSIQVRDASGVQVFQDLDAGGVGVTGAGSVTLTNVAGGNAITAQGQPTVTSYTDKTSYVFTVAAVNTGPVTLNINAQGAKPVLKNNRAPLAANDLVIGDNVSATYSSSLDAFVIDRAIPAIGGHLFGFTMSNNVGDADKDLDVSVGEAASDDTSGKRIIALTAALTKQLDQNWQVGNNAGGLDAGGVAANTTYHVFAIMRSDTGNVDVLFSASATAPTMPANYDYKRRVGSIITDASSNIIGFVQNGDQFTLKTPLQDLQTANPSSSGILQTMTVPSGVSVLWDGAGLLTDTGQLSPSVYLSPPDADDIAPDVATNAQLYAPDLAGGTTTAFGTAVVKIRTNTVGQIRYRAASAGATTQLTLKTHGWIDDRGKES